MRTDRPLLASIRVETAQGGSLERKLVEQAQRGDSGAFDAIVRRKVQSVYGTALAILGQEADAQDAVQEAFVSAWRSIAGLRDPDRFDAWFGRILVNSCRATIRRKRNVRELRLGAAGPIDHAPRDDSSVADLPDIRPSLADAAVDADRFDRAFSSLTIDERTLLVLRHRDDESVEGIAGRLGIPAGTVKSRLFAARRSLERALAKEDR